MILVLLSVADVVDLMLSLGFADFDVVGVVDFEVGGFDVVVADLVILKLILLMLMLMLVLILLIC